RPFTVALVGNPNTGKSTLFGGLVGVHQHVGNYPGVTVEKRIGHTTFAGRRFEMIDLPGLYSLAPRSRDEMVVVDLLLGRMRGQPAVDAVVCIVDAGNLERNLYLVSQVLELGLPTVLALNMVDVAERRGIRVDAARLEEKLGVPVVAVRANRRLGLDRLMETLAEFAFESEGLSLPKTIAALPGCSEAVCRGCGKSLGRHRRRGAECGAAPAGGEGRRPRRFRCHSPLPEAFEAEVALFEAELADDPLWGSQSPMPRCLLRRLLLDSNGYLQGLLLDKGDGRWASRLAAARARLAAAGVPIPAVETAARYDWARRITEDAVSDRQSSTVTTSDRLDHVLTHRFWGTLIFLAVMLVVFQSVFVWAQPAMDGIETVIVAAGVWVESHMAEGMLRSLAVEGVLGGVGAVAIFLPQILILFGFIALLEDCGYMARTAFLMDRLMAWVGLSGKTFIPLLSSFACAVPGIMATRVIENERDRLTTILVAPLLTCSARLPIYAMLIAAFIPARRYLGGLLNLQGLTLAGLYLLGISAAVIAAMIFKRTLFRGATPPFMMELPSYKWPSPRTVLLRMAERGWMFVRCAGTLILLVSILVWAALYFPRDPNAAPHEQQRNSYLGRAGQVIEPAVKPLGWDWRIGCAVIASLPARELVVATLGVMYNVDDELAPHDRRWRDKLKKITWDGTDRPVYTLPVALGIMVFFALCAQCAATLAVIRRETNSWRWPLFTFSYMTVLAYVAALITYQVGSWLAG
ncbi:MAG: ferrous iron transporter B, partial [Pirellulaceae bacterium]|nr:ferrous iron transporter B [Pirellulaceae bacterium]